MDILVQMLDKIEHERVSRIHPFVILKENEHRKAQIPPQMPPPPPK